MSGRQPANYGIESLLTDAEAGGIRLLMSAIHVGERPARWHLANL